LGSFSKITELAQIFPNVPNTCVFILETMGWTQFWATFSQSHLVALFMMQLPFLSGKVHMYAITDPGRK
jgi:hypothetical protein